MNCSVVTKVVLKYTNRENSLRRLCWNDYFLLSFVDSIDIELKVNQEEYIDCYTLSNALAL
jgi:hypothetical protein